MSDVESTASDLSDARSDDIEVEPQADFIDANNNVDPDALRALLQQAYDAFRKEPPANLDNIKKLKQAVYGKRKCSTCGAEYMLADGVFGYYCYRNGQRAEHARVGDIDPDGNLTMSFAELWRIYCNNKRVVFPPVDLWTDTAPCIVPRLIKVPVRNRVYEDDPEFRTRCVQVLDPFATTFRYSAFYIK